MTETAFTGEARRLLGKPLDPRVVKVKTVAGHDVPYLDTAYVINTANEIFGQGNWGFTIEQPWCEPSGEPDGKGDLWCCMGTLTVTGGCVFTDIGDSERSGKGPAALSMAIKGAASDALKRCFRLYGEQFGIRLYDKSVTADEMSRDLADWEKQQAIREQAGSHTKADVRALAEALELGVPPTVGAKAVAETILAAVETSSQPQPEWCRYRPAGCDAMVEVDEERCPNGHELPHPSRGPKVAPLQGEVVKQKPVVQKPEWLDEFAVWLKEQGLTLAHEAVWLVLRDGGEEARPETAVESVAAIVRVLERNHLPIEGFVAKVEKIAKGLSTAAKGRD